LATAHYGGQGGIDGCRAMNTDDAFEMAVNRALGDRKIQNALAAEGWGYEIEDA
jgi:hypothetical protein